LQISQSNVWSCWCLLPVPCRVTLHVSHPLQPPLTSHLFLVCQTPLVVIGPLNMPLVWSEMFFTTSFCDCLSAHISA
jgi:hypothetical protein